MKRLILASIVLVSVAACFDFDGAYNQYCQRNNCGGGTGGGLNPTGGGLTTGGGLAGGSTAGGSTAGGDAAGGTSAGGAGGGSTAGGAAAGGSAGASAGGSAVDAGVDAGMPDAGVMCTGAPFCVHRQTQRTDFKGADAVFGTTLDNGGALFSRYGTMRGTIWVSHGPDGTPSTGTTRLFTGGAPPMDVMGQTNTVSDLFVVTESDLITARLQRVIDGGIPQVRYSGTCAGMSVTLNAYDRVGNKIVMGGDDDGLCEFDTSTNQFTLLQAEGPGSSRVTDVYISPGNEIFWTTTDGYIGKYGVGRITSQIDPSGMVAIDGLDGDNVWAIGDQGIITTRNIDGGFDTVATLTSRAYSLRVTTDGIFVGTFGGIAHKTRYTDGGFELFGLPVDPTHRVWGLAGGPGALHAVGDEGPFSAANQAFFITLIPRTQ